MECTPSDMLVRLALSREFNGRIYATGNPQSCFELGNGQSDMTLRIPLGTQCGTVQQVSNRFYPLSYFLANLFAKIRISHSAFLQLPALASWKVWLDFNLHGYQSGRRVQREAEAKGEMNYVSLSHSVVI